MDAPTGRPQQPLGRGAQKRTGGAACGNGRPPAHRQDRGKPGPGTGEGDVASRSWKFPAANQRNSPARSHHTILKNIIPGGSAEAFREPGYDDVNKKGDNLP